MLVLLLVLFCWKKEAGKRLILLLIAVNVWLPMIKAVALRPRPYMKYPDRVKPLQLVETDADAMDVAAQGYSFPSGHSASAAALYPSLAQEIKKKWAWTAAAAITLLVGVSRSVVGMHYPTDVLAGWGIGFAGIGIFHLLDKLENERVRHLILLLTALPGLFYVRTQDYFTSLGIFLGLLAAFPFEEKFIRYEDTRRIPAMILRLVLAFGIYFVLNTLLKMPFDSAFLESARLGAFLIRTVRYAVIVFVIIGVYPLAFPWFEKVGKRV